MSIAKAKFDALPDLGEEDQYEAWEDCVLKIVDQFSLTAKQYEEIEGRYSTIGEIFLNPRNAALDGAHFFTQGSFLTRTVIKPPSCGEIDVDAVVWLPNKDRLDADEVFDAVHDELKERVRTERGVEPKNRCTRVLYADENPTFHLDVTAAVNAFGNDGESGEGKLAVPDRKAIEAGEGDGWKPSAPKLFADWVNESAEFKVTLLRKAQVALCADSATGTREPLPSKELLDRFDPLRATVKLLKYHREKFFAERTDEEFKPISVLLTTLACRAYRSVATRSTSRSMTAMEAIIAIVDEMPNHFDAPTATVPRRLCNPAYKTENFAERWNDAKDGARRVKAFQEWHAQIRMDIRLGLKAFDSTKEFTTSVVAAFGTRGTQAMLDQDLDSAISRGGSVMGLSAAAINDAKQPSAVDRMFGVGTNRPRQEPEPLKRLG
jgi:hypothetical protein